MKALVWLAVRHLVHYKVRNLLLVACLALVVFIPIVGGGLLTQYDQDLRSRAADTPLVLGQPGNRFDLCLGSLFFQNRDLKKLAFDALTPWVTRHDLIAVPLHLGFQVQGHPLVGTSPEYFAQRGLQVTSGRLPLRPGEIVLGAKVAATLKATLGHRLQSDPTDGFGIRGQTTQTLLITGFLAEQHGPDDRAVFASLQTAWLCEGQLHGHADAQQIALDNPALVLAEAQGDVLLSGELVPDQGAGIERPERLHLHGDMAELPLSAVLIWPESDKVRTLVQTATNAEGPLQMLRPTSVVRDLLALTLRFKSLIDRLVWVLGTGMAILFVVVCVLSAQLRSGELRTLARMGASPGFATRLLALEAFGVGLAAILLGGLGATLALRWLPDLIRIL